MLAKLNFDLEDDLGDKKSRDEGKETPPEVSVVIPCLNEERTLGACIDKALTAFKTAGIAGEVVVADNGSTDSSAAVAERHGARVVYVPERGYGNALRKGIEGARADFIIMGDADGSHDFSELPRFVAKWRDGYELVLGNRFAGGIKPGAMSWHHRYVGNPALTTILNSFFHAGVGDAYCGMRGFTKRVYQGIDLRTTGMEFALEFIIKATKLGVRLTEVPITMWPDLRNRPPHLRTFRDGWRSVRFMLLYAPNWLFLLPGGLLVALGIGLVLWLLPGPRFAGKVGAIGCSYHLDWAVRKSVLVRGKIHSEPSLAGKTSKTCSVGARIVAGANANANRTDRRWRCVLALGRQRLRSAACG
jgi:glycosyltransferase involved in cell wall biosynthesis